MTQGKLTFSKGATYDKVEVAKQALLSEFPYFAKTIDKRLQEFGIPWLVDFEMELNKFFGEDEERLHKATRGYGQFSLDAMKMQKRFDKARKYPDKTYADALRNVYLNRDYMFDLYLPGILLSNYLWPHHYQQLLLFRGSFLPQVEGRNLRRFYDVGIGTGFYSKEFLRGVDEISGVGCDISPFSLEHTAQMVRIWGGSDRYECVQRDIVMDTPDEKADSIICVEVLEHLEDPVTFLKSLSKMLRPGGLGFITAAINAPNADHIYLYESAAQVADDIRAAGFRVMHVAELYAYEPKPKESVPSSGICIVEGQ